VHPGSSGSGGNAMRALLLVAVATVLGGLPTASAADRPLYYARPITEADVAGRTLRELAILRNTIFARAGQPFRKHWLHEYFAAQPWYKVKGVVDPRTLSAVDQQNADLLSRRELALPRAELERRLEALLARHAYGLIAGGRRAVAFSPDGNEVLLGEMLQIKRVDLVRGKTAVIREDSFRLDDDLGGLGLVPGPWKTIAFTNMHLEVNDLEARGPRTHTSIQWNEVHDARANLGGRNISWSRRGVFSADGRRLLAGPSVSHTDGDNGDDITIIDQRDVVAFDIPEARIIFRKPVDDDDDHPCFALSPDGARAVVSAAGKFSLWDLATEKTVWTHARADARPRASKKAADANHCWEVAFSADGRWVLEAAPAESILFEVQTGRVARTLALPFGTALAFSPDGTQLLAGGPARPAGAASSLELWDVTRGARVRVLPAPGDTRAVAWSPDGKRAVSHGDRGPTLWDVAAGRAIAGVGATGSGSADVFAGHETWWNRDEQIEAVLLSRAVGRKLAQFESLDFERTPFDAPELLDELVPVEQLTQMSRRDLRLLRNMVYARRGRPFRSPLLRAYFENLAWYKADPAYTDARLKALDRRNIKLIQSAEIEAGGPINDALQRQEEEVPEA